MEQPEMDHPRKRLTRKKPEPSSESTTPELQPVGGITRDNYREIAKAFMATNGGKGFMIAIRQKSFSGNYEIEPTILQWGAWSAWRKSKGLSGSDFGENKRTTNAMDALGYYMVPAQWPWEFDADCIEGAIMASANKFFDRHIAAQRAESERRNQSAEYRRSVIQSARERPYAEPPYPPVNFPFGGKPISLDRPSHPPAYGTVFYDESGCIIPPLREKSPKSSSFKRLGEVLPKGGQEPR